VPPPFAWRDVLDEPPPTEASDPSPRRCVRGPEIILDVQRVENALLVTAHREGGAIEVEDFLYVTERALSGAIQTERETVGAVLDAAGRSSDRAAGRGLRLARNLERSGRPAAPLAPVLRAIVTAVHAAWAWVLRGARKLTRGIAAAPDRLGQSTRRAVAYLSTQEGRRQVWAAMKDPRKLHAEQKAASLFVGTILLLATMLLAHLVVTLAIPVIAVRWRAGVLLFGYGYVTSIGIPLPWEPALIAGALALGPVIAICVAVAAKLVAGYMVFFLGDEVNEKLEARAATHPWFARMLRASERFAQRFGIFAMALFIATPGLPDAIALYVFGSLGMSVRKYLLGILLGALVLDAVVIFGGMRLLGLG
jgi:uncharacterized membrane protein YdjX (TVP38/TMEM64 family)